MALLMATLMITPDVISAVDVYRMGIPVYEKASPANRSVSATPMPWERNSAGLEEALKENFEVLSADVPTYSVRKSQSVALPQHITNVTRGSFAYHLDGQSMEGYRIAIGVDASKVRTESELNEVQVFYLDGISQSWQRAHVLKVDHQKLRVEAMVPGETDYFSGLIQSPDMPEASAFAPTSISDIEPANPATGIRMIQPPTANRKGSANVDYPLWVPAGRAGLSPQLAVSYSSDGGAGWVGHGWSIAIPTIEIDTRLGVPRFDGTKETEGYLFNGEALFKEGGKRPNRSDNDGHIDTRPTGSNVETRFFTKSVSSYSEIVRHGSSPATYYWTVTDGDNNVYYYGTLDGQSLNTASALTSPTNSNKSTSPAPIAGVSRWYLTKVTDKWGNTMTYNYSKQRKTVSNNNLNSGGFSMVPSSIQYTGYGTDAGKYSVHFITSGNREDARISMNMGLKFVDDQRLNRIDVKYENNVVVQYLMDYNQNHKTGKVIDGSTRFFKTLLTEISERRNGKTFYSHKMDYHEGEYGFSETPDQVIETSVLAPFLGGAPEWTQDFLGDVVAHVMPSPLSNSLTSGASGGGSAGAGADAIPSLDKDQTLSGKIGFSSSKTTVSRMFRDVSGDGLPDLVYRHGGKMAYKPLERDNQGNYSLGKRRTIDAKQVQKSTSNSLNTSVDFVAEKDILYFGANWNTSWSNTKVSMTDYNLDGIVDLVEKDNDGNYHVVFGEISSTGDLSFNASSEQTYSPVLKDSDVGAGDSDALTKPFEVVRSWTATKNGTVNISGVASIFSPFEGKVKVAVQKEGEYLLPNGSTTTNPSGAIRTIETGSAESMDFTTTVTKGQRLFFRAMPEEDGQQDFLVWNPQVSYTNSASYTDGNGTPFNSSTYDDGFLPSGGEAVYFQAKDAVKIIPNTSNIGTELGDDIQLRISLYEKETGALTEQHIEQVTKGTTQVGSAFNGFSMVGSFHTLSNNTNIDPEKEYYLVFSVWAPSTVDWQEVSWRPTVIIDDDCYSTPIYPTIDFKTYNGIFSHGGSHGNLNLNSSAFYEVMPTILMNQTYLNDLYAGQKSREDVVYMVVKSDGQAIAHKAIEIDYNKKLPSNINIKSLDGDWNLGGTLSNSSMNNNDPRARFSGIEVKQNTLWVEFFAHGEMGQQLATYLSANLSALKLYSSAGGFTTLPLKKNIYNTSYSLLQEKHLSWGQFAWSPKDGEELFVIDPAKIQLPAQAEMDNGANFEDENYLTGAKADALNPQQQEFFMMQPMRGEKNFTLRTYQVDDASTAGTIDPTKVDRWTVMGSHMGLFQDGKCFPGFYGEEEDEKSEFAPASNDTYTAMAVGSKSKSFSLALNGGVGAVSLTESVVNDNKYFSRTTAQFVDLNGDGYADAIKQNNGDLKVQYTNATGGHGSEENFSLTNLNKGASNNSSFAPNGSFINKDKRFEEMKFSGGVDFGESRGIKSLTDINGDGLPDEALDNGKVSLNKGYGFASPVTINYLADRSTNSSFNLGVSQGLWKLGKSKSSVAQSFSGGLNINFVGSSAQQFYMDFNGDGLEDRMMVYYYNGKSNCTLLLNTGSSFKLYAPNSTLDQRINQNTGMGFSANLSGTFSFPFMAKISVNGSVSGNLSVNRLKSSFMDINGDGAMDFVHSNDLGNTEVYYATLGKANKLKTVSNPLGGSFEVDYELVGNKVGYKEAIVKTPASNTQEELVIWDMPTAKWVMSSVTVHDGVDLLYQPVVAGNSSNKTTNTDATPAEIDLDGVDSYTTTFAYDGGIKNRRERDFVGFTRVATIQPNQLDENGDDILIGNSVSHIYGLHEGRPVIELIPDDKSGKHTSSQKSRRFTSQVELYHSPSSLDPNKIIEWSYSSSLLKRSLKQYNHDWIETFDSDTKGWLTWEFSHTELISEESYDYTLYEVDTESGSTQGQVRYDNNAPVVADLSSFGETGSVFPAVVIKEDVSFPVVSEREKYIAHKYEITYDEYFNVIRYKDFGESQPGPLSLVQVDTHEYFDYEFVEQTNNCADKDSYDKLEGPGFYPFMGLVVPHKSDPNCEPAIVWLLDGSLQPCLNNAPYSYATQLCGPGEEFFETEHRKKVLRQVPIYEMQYKPIYTGTRIAELTYFDPSDAGGRVSALEKQEIFLGSTNSTPVRKSEVTALWTGNDDSKEAPSTMRHYQKIDNQNPVYGETDIEYDTYGNVIKIEGPLNGAATPVRSTVEYTYDNAVHQFVEGIENNFGEKVCSKYDYGTQQLLQTIGINGHPMRYQYDDADRLAAVWAPRELYDGTQGPTISFEYYPGGDPNATNPAPVALTYHNTGVRTASVTSGNAAPSCNLVTFPTSTMTKKVGTATFVDGLDRVIQLKTDVDGYENGAPVQKHRVSGITTYNKFALETVGRLDFLTASSSGLTSLEVQNSSEITTMVYDNASRIHTKASAWSKKDAGGIDVLALEPAAYLYAWRDDLSYTGFKDKDYFTTGVTLDGTTTTEYVDARGNKIASSVLHGTDEITTQFEFDDLTQLKNVINPIGLVTNYRYNDLGQVTHESHPDRGITQTSYDPAGNVASINTPAGTTTLTYDHNRLIRKSLSDATSALLYNVSYEYGTAADAGDNALGRLKKITQGQASNPVLVEEFKYDELGNNVWNNKAIDIPMQSVQSFTTESHYDSFGRLLKLVYPDGENVNYGYSDLGSLLTIQTTKPGMIAGDIISDIHYDGFDNIKEIQYGNETSTTYDYHQYTRSMSTFATEAKAKSISSFGQVQHKSFDYNNREMIQSVSAQVDGEMFQPKGSTTSAAPMNYTHTFTYDGFNRLTEAVLSDYNFGNNTEAYRVTMAFDDAGRITENTAIDANTSSLVSSGGLNRDWTYGYKSGTHQIDFIQQTGVPSRQEYSFNTSGSIKRRAEVDIATKTTSNEEIFLWNQDQQLVAVSNDQGLHHYIYDHSGTRIMKSSLNQSSLSVNDNTVSSSSILNPYMVYVNEYYVQSGFSNGAQITKHYYMGMQRVVSDIGVQPYIPINPGGGGNGTESSNKTDEESSDKNLVIEHLVGVLTNLGKEEGKDYSLIELLEPITLEEYYPEYASMLTQQGGTDSGTESETGYNVGIRYWYHPDYLGSVDLVTDGDGVVYQYFLNNPWGEELHQYKAQGTFDSPYRFNGKEFDQETGLAYYGARFYDNKLGVWMSVDPMAARGPNISPYAFSHNNPVELVDPDGNWPLPIDELYDILTILNGISKPNTYLVISTADGGVAPLGGELDEVTIVAEKLPKQEETYEPNDASVSVNQVSTAANVLEYELDKSIEYLNSNAFPSYQSGCGKCARAVRLAIDAGGIDTSERGTSSTSAKDYGANLKVWGYSEIDSENYEPQKGDVRVIQPPKGKTHGHMNMFNGEKWVSDFVERDFWPGSAYRTEQPEYKIYRHSSLIKN